MTHKIFGKRTIPTDMPYHYDQSTVLQITRIDQEKKPSPIAHGKWIKEEDMYYPVFVLFAGSWIIKKGDFSKEPGIAEIKKELIDNLLLEDTGLDDFELKKDIHFWYSSTAGKLVQGQHSNGLVDWKNPDGVMLGHLLYPDNPKYY